MVDLIKNNLEYDDLSFMKKCHAHAFWNFLLQDKDGAQVEPESTDTKHVIRSESEQQSELVLTSDSVNDPDTKLTAGTDIYIY